MADATTVDIARERLEAAIDGCLIGDMAPAEIHQVILDVLYQADIPLPPMAYGPCIDCGAWLFAHTPQGWETLKQERCPGGGSHPSAVRCPVTGPPKRAKIRDRRSTTPPAHLSTVPMASPRLSRNRPSVTAR